MATYTDNYNLIKPDYNEDADINDLNSNFDVLDTQIKSIFDSAATATAELAEIIDGGTKNKLNITKASIKSINTIGSWNDDVYTRNDNGNSMTFTLNSDLTITVNGTAANRIQFNLKNSGLQDFQGCVLSGGGSASLLFQMSESPYSTIANDTGNGTELGAYDNSKSYSLSINISAGVTVNNLIIKPMICAKSAWDISNKYVPYCPSLAEIYQMLTT